MYLDYPDSRLASQAAQFVYWRWLVNEVGHSIEPSEKGQAPRQKTRIIIVAHHTAVSLCVHTLSPLPLALLTIITQISVGLVSVLPYPLPPARTRHVWHNRLSRIGKARKGKRKGISSTVARPSLGYRSLGEHISNALTSRLLSSAQLPSF